jgi:hypothetical protein
MLMRTCCALIAIIASVFISNSALAGDCGSKVGKLSAILTLFVIPNKFPPDSPVLKALLSNSDLAIINSCEPLYGRADLSSACIKHDLCYDVHGVSKGNCDRQLLEGWEATCKHQYRNMFTRILGVDVAYPDNPVRSACRTACVTFVGLMSEAQKVNQSGFCPSCDAFNEAQSRSVGSPTSGSLVTFHSGCDSGDKSRTADCVSAMHQWCTAHGGGAGLSQEVGSTALAVACMPGSLTLVPISDLSSLHPGCNSSGKSQTAECVSAMHQWCTAHGGGAGLSQEVGPSDLAVACMPVLSFNSVPIR